MTQSTTSAAAPSAPVRTATVLTFKASGKYYTTESWRVPADAIGPYDMDRSPDFHQIDGGVVLVATDAENDGDQNWGYPQILTGPRR